MKKLSKNLLSLLFLLATTAMFSQGSTTSSINGKIYDEKMVSLPGATILAIHSPQELDILHQLMRMELLEFRI